MGLGAAHPTANGALLDHPGANRESLHPQSYDVLQEKLVRDNGFFPVCRRLLREVVSHQVLVSKSAVPVDGDSPLLRPSPLIYQLRTVFKLLHIEEEA